MKTIDRDVSKANALHKSYELTMGRPGNLLFNNATKSLLKINGVDYHNLLVVDPDRESRKILVAAILPGDTVSMHFSVGVTLDNDPLYHWQIMNNDNEVLTDSGRMTCSSNDNMTINAMKDFHAVLESSEDYDNLSSLMTTMRIDPWLRGSSGVPSTKMMGPQSMGIPETPRRWRELL